MKFSKIIITFLVLSTVGAARSNNFQLIKKTVNQKISSSNKVFKTQMNRVNLIKKLEILDNCLRSPIAKVFGKSFCIDRIKVSI